MRVKGKLYWKRLSNNGIKTTVSIKIEKSNYIISFNVYVYLEGYILFYMKEKLAIMI